MEEEKVHTPGLKKGAKLSGKLDHLDLISEGDKELE